MTALFYPFRKRKNYTRDKSSFFATRFALYILAGWRYALITAYQLVRGKSILPRPEQLISFIPQPFPAEPMLRGLFLRIHGLSESGYGSGCMGGVFCREKLGFLSSRRADRFPKPHGLYRHILKRARGYCAVLIKQYGMCFPKVACCIQAEHPKNPWTLRVFYFLYRSYCFLYPHFGHTPFSFSAMPQRGQRSKVPSGLYS